MDLNEIERLMLETFADDRRLARRERKELRAVFGRADLDHVQRRWLLSRAFEVTRDDLAGSGESPALEWLEEISRLLIPEHVPQTEAFFTSSDDNGLVRKIREWLDEASRTVEICVYTITDNRLRKAIFAAHDRGVAVRVISDDEKTEDEGSDIGWLKRKGVEVRTDSSEHYMHHKFALFDQRRVATGSFNWTRSAAEHNLENITLSDDRRLVEAYSREFDRLWDLFAP